MSNQPRATSNSVISNWVRQAAVSKSWRPGHYLGRDWQAMAELYQDHAARVQTSLGRAQSKTFVRVAKPLRGLFRNQGAVNDSLIEAVHHLAAQNEMLIEQVGELRDAVAYLGRRAQGSAGSENPEPAPSEDSCES